VHFAESPLHSHNPSIIISWTINNAPSFLFPTKQYFDFTIVFIKLNMRHRKPKPNHFIGETAFIGPFLCKLPNSFSFKKIQEQIIYAHAVLTL